MGCCELSSGVVSFSTGKWKPHQGFSRIKLDCATGSTTAYNTQRLFEQWSIFNPVLLSAMLQLTCPRRPCCRQQAPHSTSCSRLTFQQTFSHTLTHDFSDSILIDFQVDLQRTFFRRPPSCVIWEWSFYLKLIVGIPRTRGRINPGNPWESPFFARLQHRPFCMNSTQFDRCETSVTTFTISLRLAFSFCKVPTFLSGISLLCERIGFVLFRCGIVLCLYSYDPWWIIADYRRLFVRM